MIRHLSLIVLSSMIIAIFCCGCSFDPKGVFIRSTWADIHGNSFRVNGPDVANGPFKDRPEAKCDGLLKIDLPAGLLGDIYDDPRNTLLYMELWGGHPGVERKRFGLNGKTEYLLPEVGTADHHCTYSYPKIRLNADELVEGENQFQFKCDTGDTFWAHYLIRAAALQTWLKDDAEFVKKHDLQGFSAELKRKWVEDEVVELSLDVDAAYKDRIDRVVFIANYNGFDENGNLYEITGRKTHYDNHGFTKDRKHQGVVAVTDNGGSTAKWDLRMIPDQSLSSMPNVHALVYFKDSNADDELVYETRSLQIGKPKRDASVILCYSDDLPAPFWSRANNLKTATINVPDIEGKIVSVRLDVLIWDGGAGEVKDPFTINGHGVKIVAGGKHEVVYTGVELDPGVIKRGANTVKLLSDTKHHGLECLLPGPAITVRFEQ